MPNILIYSLILFLALGCWPHSGFALDAEIDDAVEIAKDFRPPLPLTQEQEALLHVESGGIVDFSQFSEEIYGDPKDMVLPEDLVRIERPLTPEPEEESVDEARITLKSPLIVDGLITPPKRPKVLTAPTSFINAARRDEARNQARKEKAQNTPKEPKTLYQIGPRDLKNPTSQEILAFIDPSIDLDELKAKSENTTAEISNAPVRIEAKPLREKHKNVISIGFPSERTDVDFKSYGAVSGRILARAYARPDEQIQLQGYARTKSGNTDEAKSISLKRALAVRNFLVRNKVSPDRISIFALGHGNGHYEKDKVDVVFVGSSSG